MINTQIGNWIIIQEEPKRLDIKSTIKRYKCKCICGSESIKRKADILKYKWCPQCEIKNRDRSSDVLGKSFGKWKVLQKSGKKKCTTSYICECECKRIYTIRGSELLSGNSKCCRHCRIATHKLSRSPIYRAWNQMKQRCNNPKEVGFHNYGGRGIKVCERWNIFENFLEDMGNRPPKKEIDRINNDGNYEPSNCRWATRKENSNNKRTNKKKS